MSTSKDNNDDSIDNYVSGRIELSSAGLDDNMFHGISIFTDSAGDFARCINDVLEASGYKFRVTIAPTVDDTQDVPSVPAPDLVERINPDCTIELVAPPKFDVGDKVTVVADIAGGGMFLADDQKVDGMSGIISFVNPNGEQKYLVYFKGYGGGHSGNGQDAGPYWYVTEESLRRAVLSDHLNMI